MTEVLVAVAAALTLIAFSAAAAPVSVTLPPVSRYRSVSKRMPVAASMLTSETVTVPVGPAKTAV